MLSGMGGWSGACGPHWCLPDEADEKAASEEELTQELLQTVSGEWLGWLVGWLGGESVSEVGSIVGRIGWVGSVKCQGG